MQKKSFIRASEYWLPSADGSILEFGGGLFGQAARFEAATVNLCFGMGEGLPGQAWECGHPVLLQSLAMPTFRRAAAAQAAGLTSAIALPVFVSDRLSTIVVLFCGDDSEHAGAMELWHNDPEEGPDMTLQDGYYGTTGDTFAFISRSTSFRYGTGLPGRTWADEAPVFMADLGRGSGFLRAESAVKVGINRGFAMPCSASNGQVYVLAMLSALATPFASQIDVWQPNAERTQLVHSLAFSAEQTDTVSPDDAPLALDSPVGQVFSTGVPALQGRSMLIPLALHQHITAVLSLSL